MATITSETIGEAVGIHLSHRVEFRHLGLLSGSRPDVLSFIENGRYLAALRANRNVRGVFATPELARALAGDNIDVIECDDPRYYYYSLYNYVAAQSYARTPTVIDRLASLHPTAHVSEFNVVVGRNTVIDPGAIVLPDVILGDDCHVGPGTVLGCENAEVKRTSHGILKVTHDGRLVVGNRVHIGAHCTVDKGFSGKDTVIGEDTKIANTTVIGHSVQVGRRCFLLCCTLLGSAVVGDDARINPGAIVSNGLTIGDGAIISLGAVVVQPVPAGGHVSGNFAIPHRRFIYKYAKLFGPFE